MTDRILSTVSIAKKAGMISSGETAVMADIRGFRSCLVMIAEDASEGTKKRFTDKCEYYEVPSRFYSTKEELARAIGKDVRSVISINDEGFAANILEKLEGADINGKQ